METSTRTPAERLVMPLEYVKGIGPERAALLARLGLSQVRDLLFHFPRDYHDLTQLCPVRSLVDNQMACVSGLVEEVELRSTSRGGSVLGVLLREESGWLRLLFFNQPYLRNQYQAGQRVMAVGKPRQKGLVWEMAHPRVQWLDAEEAPPHGVWPVYPACEGLTQGRLRQMVASVLETHAGLLEEVFPAAILESWHLEPIQQALEQIHFPPDLAALERARRRFVFQELLILQLALGLRRQARRAEPAVPLEATARIDARIRRLFPFELTAGQQQAIAEVAADMNQPYPMNRLLQGDVGSGKTVVAVYALLLAVAHGRQAALMAPTEILARQHYQTLGALLQAGKVRIGLLVGGLSSSERSQLLRDVLEGRIDVLLGTQAILQEDVVIPRLALVVIDEQHKFGVRQRALLQQGGQAPHCLVMTATPIPRTVSLTLYGDLEVSTLRDSPAGRQPVRTYLARPDQRARWWSFVRKKLEAGRQAYVIVPWVQEQEQSDAPHAEAVFQSLQQGELRDFSLGLLHGRMPAAEKEAAMQAFRSGQTQVLVATSVVEVGIDVPNATLLTIEQGQRFGLSQLHQLRGRITRGHHPGFCCVFADPTTPEAHQRLAAFESTDDGFALAETDLKLRGPGDLFGTRQHGLPPLRVADLVRDAAVIDETRQAAAELLQSDPELALPDHALLHRRVLAKYGQVLELGDVG